jgi:hypothetical protein
MQQKHSNDVSGQYTQVPPGVMAPQNAQYYSLPPPTYNYTGTTVQGWDMPNASGAVIAGFPTYPNGYFTYPPPEGFASGLSTAWSPWNREMKKAPSRQDRADEEAIVVAYWPQSPTFGPGGTDPADSVVIVYSHLPLVHADH